MRNAWRLVGVVLTLGVMTTAIGWLLDVPRISPDWTGNNAEHSRMDIEQAFELHHDRIMAIPGVTGMGIGEAQGRPAIVILIRQLTPELKTKLPTSIEGHPVVIEQTGEISAF